jgi:hypothetical protein
LKISPRFRALKLPFGKDISDFYLQGGDVYEWLEVATRIGEVSGG